MISIISFYVFCIIVGWYATELLTSISQGEVEYRYSFNIATTIGGIAFATYWLF